MDRRLFVVGSLLAPACASQTLQQSAPRTDDAAMAQAIRDYFGPLAAQADASGVVRIERGGQVTEICLGYADWAARTPMQVSTRFAAGSITKSMTATILLKLAQDGAIDAAADVSAYLPEYQHGAGMSVDLVLRHQAGLPRDIAEADRTGFGAGGLVGWLNAHPPTQGAGYSYSNVGYELIALIVARRTQRPYPTLAREIIFVPLGMSESSIEARSRVSGAATPHAPGPAPLELRAAPDASVPVGAAGLVASAGDLARWGRAVRDGTIVSLRGADGEMRGSVGGYDDGAHKAHYMQGMMPGTGAVLMPFLNDDAVVVYAFNVEAYPQMSAERVLGPIAFGLTGATPPLRPASAALTDAHRALAGRYALQNFGPIEIRDAGTEMRIVFGGGHEQYLTPVSEGRLCWRTFGHTFAPTASGISVSQVMVTLGAQPETYETARIA